MKGEVSSCSLQAKPLSESAVTQHLASTSAPELQPHLLSSSIFVNRSKFRVATASMQFVIRPQLWTGFFNCTAMFSGQSLQALTSTE